MVTITGAGGAGNKVDVGALGAQCFLFQHRAGDGRDLLGVLHIAWHLPKLNVTDFSTAYHYGDLHRSIRCLAGTATESTVFIANLLACR